MQEIKKYYTETHQWLKSKGDRAEIGITSYGRGVYGELLHIEFEQSIGEKLSQGEKYLSIESMKAVSELESPISGTIEEQNTKLTENPEYFQSNKEEENWLIRLHSTENAGTKLLTHEEYQRYIEASEQKG